jgi:predicted nucleotidyltransferase
MIPDCDDHGYLPPGIHPATLDQIAARFGRESELRQAQMESLRWLVDLARCSGVRRIVLNGSFVTDKIEPNDVDCVLLIGPDFPQDTAAEAELLAGLPFINMELVDPRAFQ